MAECPAEAQDPEQETEAAWTSQPLTLLVLFNAAQLGERGLTLPINSEHVYVYISTLIICWFKLRSPLPASKSGLCLGFSSVSRCV